MRIYQMKADEVAALLKCDLQNGGEMHSAVGKSSFLRNVLRFFSGLFKLLNSKLYYVNIITVISYAVAVIFSCLNQDWYLLRLTIAAIVITLILYFAEGIVLYRYKTAYYNRSVRCRQKVQVIRGGQQIEIAPENLHIGDLICLNIGTVLYCDARIVESEGLFADETRVFGSTIPSEKTEEPIAEQNISAEKQKNMLWKGSSVSAGSGKAIVMALDRDCYVDKTGGRKERKQRSFFYNKQKNIGQIASYIYVVLVAFCLLIAVIFTNHYVEAFLMMAAMTSLIMLNPVSCLMEWTYYRTAAKLYRQGVLVRNIEAFDGMNKEKKLYFNAGDLLDEQLVYSHTLDLVGSEKSSLSYFSLCMGPGYYSNAVQNALDRYGLTYEQLDNSFPVFRREKDDSGNLFALFSDNGRSVVVAVGYWQKMLPMIGQIDESLLEQIHELEIHGKMVYIMASDSMDFIPSKLDFTYFSGHMETASLVVFHAPVHQETLSMIHQLQRSTMKVFLINDYAESFGKAIADSYDMDGVLSSPPDAPSYSLPRLKDYSPAVYDDASPVEKERAMVVLGGGVVPQRVIYQVKCMFCGIRRCLNFLAITSVFLVFTILALFLSGVPMDQLIFPALLLKPVLLCPCYYLIETVRNCNQFRRSLILGMFCGSAGIVAALISCDLALFTLGLSTWLLSVYFLLSGMKKLNIRKQDMAWLIVVLPVLIIPCIITGGNWLPAVLLALFPPLGAMILDLFY